MEKLKENVQYIWSTLVDRAMKKELVAFDDLVKSTNEVVARDALLYIHEYCYIKDLPPLSSIVVGVDSQVILDCIEYYGDLAEAQVASFDHDWNHEKNLFVIPSSVEVFDALICGNQKFNDFVRTFSNVAKDDIANPHEDELFYVAKLHDGKVYADKSKEEWYDAYEPPERLLQNGDIVVTITNGVAETAVFEGKDDSVGISWDESFGWTDVNTYIFRPESEFRNELHFLVRFKPSLLKLWIEYYWEILHKQSDDSCFANFLFEKARMPYNVTDENLKELKKLQRSYQSVSDDLRADGWEFERDIVLNGCFLDFCYGINNQKKGYVIVNTRKCEVFDDHVDFAPEIEQNLQLCLEKNPDLLLSVYINGLYYDQADGPYVTSPAATILTQEKKEKVVSETKVISKDPAALKLYEDVENELKKMFTESVWNSSVFEEKTKKYLISSKIYLHNISKYENDFVDYSGVCCPAVKALELELTKLFCRDYIAYQKKKFGDDLSLYTSCFLKIKDKSIELITPSKDNLLSYAGFTLGMVPVILGLKQERREEIHNVCTTVVGLDSIVSLAKEILRHSVLSCSSELWIMASSRDEKLTVDLKEIFTKKIEYLSKKYEDTFEANIAQFYKMDNVFGVMQDACGKLLSTQLKKLFGKQKKNKQEELLLDIDLDLIQSAIQVKTDEILEIVCSFIKSSKQKVVLKSLHDINEQNKNNVVDYALDILKPSIRESLGKNDEDKRKALRGHLDAYAKVIGDIASKYRNKACHVDSMDATQAQMCLQVVIGDKDHDCPKNTAQEINEKVYAILKDITQFFGKEEISQEPTTQNS